MGLYPSGDLRIVVFFLLLGPRNLLRHYQGSIATFFAIM